MAMISRRHKYDRVAGKFLHSNSSMREEILADLHERKILSNQRRMIPFGCVAACLLANLFHWAWRVSKSQVILIIARWPANNIDRLCVALLF